MMPGKITNNFLELLKENNKVHYIYQYGSSVYGVQSENSDTDFLIITEKDFEIPEEFINFAYEIEHIREDRIIRNIKYDNYDFIFYTNEEWFEMVLNNQIEPIECASLPRKFIHKEFVKLPVKIDHVKLRQEISAICSNAYVKAKKKINQGDYYIGKKSLWHSIRVALFGIQVAQNKKIINYKEANKYYNDIVLSDINDWDYYHDKYHTLSNNLRTEFRKVTEGAWTEHCKKKVLEKQLKEQNND